MIAFKFNIYSNKGIKSKVTFFFNNRLLLLSASTITCNYHWILNLNIYEVRIISIGHTLHIIVLHKLYLHHLAL